MRHPRFSLSTLLWSVPVVAVVTLTAPRYLQAPPSTIVDLTAGAPSRCEVHRRRMKPQIVELRSGTNDRPPDQDDREAARRKHFPHTDESVDQAPLAGKYQFARVWTCPDCTTARGLWTDKRKIQQRVQAEEHARRLAEPVEQQRRARGDQEDLLPDAAEEYSE